MYTIKLKKAYVLFLFIIISAITFSCKRATSKIGKEISEELIEAASKKSIKKSITKSASQKTLLKGLSRGISSEMTEKLIKVGFSNKAIKRIAEIEKSKQEKLFLDAIDNPSLLQKINAEPKLSLRKWLNTRNHVIKEELARPNGRYPINGQVYAGNTYYFDIDFNHGLAALVKSGKVSPNTLQRLDKLYPNGVPFNKKGYPDFTKVAVKYKNKPLIVNLGKNFDGSTKDIATAEKICIQQNKGYSHMNGTWHHIENSTSLVKVPTEIHQLIRHTGGAADVRY